MNGKVVKSYECGDGVARCCGDGCSLQPPAEDKEEDVVEHHVDDAADEGGEHRETRLSRRNEEDVEDQPCHRERCRDEERNGIHFAERIERIVRAEEVENRVQEGHAEHGNHRAENDADEDEQGEIFACMAIFARAELRCNERTPARAEHGCKHNRERDERHDDVDRRQSIRPDGVRDEEAVDDEVHIHKEL